MSDKLLNLYNSMSLRERRLLGGVIALGLVMIGVMLVQNARLRLVSLDAQISVLQNQIVNSKDLMLRRETVEEDYEGISAQHSSAWTQEEIQDRLRAEIHRLAQISPPDLAEDGRPVALTNNSGELVSITTIPEGNLEEAEDGYREFALRFRIPETNMEAVTDFLERLQMSPQSLRIDALDLARNPTMEDLTANILLTRTVVDGPPEGSAINPGAGDTTGELVAANWVGEGCNLSNVEESLVVESGSSSGFAYKLKNLPAGETYEMFLDARTDGEVILAMAEDNADTLLEGSQLMEQDPKGAFRYRVQFTVPGTSGRVGMWVPCFLLNSEDAKVEVNTLLLRKVSVQDDE